MKDFITSLGRIVVISLLSSVALSAIFWGIQWVFSLFTVVSTPTWHKFIWGAIGIFIVLILWNFYKWFKLYKRMYKLQKACQDYPIDFRMYVMDQKDWEVAEVEKDEGFWLQLIPNPMFGNSLCYYIKYTGYGDANVAIDVLLSKFYAYINGRRIVRDSEEYSRPSIFKHRVGDAVRVNMDDGSILTGEIVSIDRARGYYHVVFPKPVSFIPAEDDEDDCMDNSWPEEEHDMSDELIDDLRNGVLIGTHVHFHF